MAEESEPILRQIRALEERMSARQDTIDYLNTILSVRREETGLSHAQLMLTDRAYRGSFYSVRALEGWQTRDRELIADLKKVIPPIENLRIILTFSIETGTGHEPFFAEVTCDTVIPAAMPREIQTEVVNRIVNAVVKLFWIMFDVQKALYDMEIMGLKGTEPYNFIVKRKQFFQKYATEIFEASMDNLLKAIIEMKALQRSRDEYVTKQAILKIGVEYMIAPKGAEPLYPIVDVLIEKGKNAETKGEWVIKRKIQIAPTIDLDMMKLLEMKTE